MLHPHYPERIVCLTEETTETLYLLGEQQRIVGISGFTVRPKQARKEKPKVSAFTSAKIDRILELQPDLVLGFSDLQADIAATLIRAGCNVHVFNQRSVNEIFNMILTLSALVGAVQKGDALVQQLTANLERVQQQARQWSRQPCVYFEEWDEPMISGIRWVSELIELAGGRDCFAEHAQYPLARNRIIADAHTVVLRQPDIIIGSWCGKKFNANSVKARSGWEVIPAVRDNHLYEIKSCDILQPGPAALTDGLTQIAACIARWQTGQVQ